MTLQQKAKIKLVLDQDHLVGWSPEKEEQIYQSILQEFQVTKDICRVKIDVVERHRIFVEFTVVVLGDSVSALHVAKQLEQRFLNLKIYSREISFRREGDTND